jgi:hypothetical protein
MAQIAAPISSHSQVSKLVVADGPVAAPANWAAVLDPLEPAAFCPCSPV